MTTSGEQPEECECCNFKTAALKLYTKCHGSDYESPDCWYCVICATTMASTMNRYHSLYSVADRQIMRAICYAANAIIEAIRESKNAT